MMKHLLRAAPILMIMATVCMGAADQQPEIVAAKLERIARQLEAQLERIKYAREIAANSMSLAEIRLVRKLSISEAALERQIAILERLKEQAQDLGNATIGAVSSVKPGPKSALGTSLSDMAEQIGQAGQLLNQMRALRVQVEGCLEDDCGQEAHTSNVSSSPDGSSKPRGVPRAQTRSLSGLNEATLQPALPPPLFR